MSGPRQFTLRFLLIQLTLVAAILGAVRTLLVTINGPPHDLGGLVAGTAILVAVVSASAAIGNCFGRFWDGAGAGVVLTAIPLAIVSVIVLASLFQQFVLGA